MHALLDGETKYISSIAVRSLLGCRLLVDVSLMRDLQGQVQREILKFLNVTEPLYVRKGLAAIEKYNEAVLNQTRDRNIEDKEEEIRQLANAAYRRNDFEGFTTGSRAYQKRLWFKTSSDDSYVSLVC